MAQNLNFSISGINTSSSDFNGLPPGSLDEADNIEIRYKNLAEPRRGFDQLENSITEGAYYIKMTNFFISGVDQLIVLTDTSDVLCKNANDPFVPVPGNYSSNIHAPDSLNGRCKFIHAGSNLYLTAQDGIRSLCSGPDSQMIKAGVPKGLNLEAETNGDTSGFFSNNQVLATSGNIDSGQDIIHKIDSTTNLTVGQYVSTDAISASLVLQDLTYTAVTPGAAGNSLNIAYTTGGLAGFEVVDVIGDEINVEIESGVSTATQVSTAIGLSMDASALVNVSISGTGSNPQTAPVFPTHLTGGLDSAFPVGTVVTDIVLGTNVLITVGTLTGGSASMSSVGSVAGLSIGNKISGVGIPENTFIDDLPGGGVVTMSNLAYQDTSGETYTFTTDTITLSENALLSETGIGLYFYAGAQVGYRMVFGRVETDINGSNITRLGAPSSIAIATNVSIFSTNNTIVGTLPKNSSDELTFVQLYRSAQTPRATVSPLDQYNLVYEAQLTNSDFTNRVITIVDDTPDSLVGIPLYCGSDQEGILQANNPPPMAWDMAKFRDFTLFGNITQPTSVKFTILAVGSPDGVQIGDVITVSGTFVGISSSGTYTGASSENQAAGEFQIYSSGTPAQNVANTAASLIRVINYDNSLPVHAILLSTATDLPGQILLEADYPSLDTFTTTASAHQDAYNPSLDDLVSNINTVNNGVCVSKSGELEAVPATNLLQVGDSSSPVIRLIPLRDYVFVVKGDGIYKIQGTSPNGLVVNPFDLTTKIVGAETAVSLNAGMWMLSNQGVVSVSDGGVELKSLPIDNQIAELIDNFLFVLTNYSFAVGYESDRKYILYVPTSDENFAQVEYNFNYTTNAWTTWSRSFFASFVNSVENKLYVSRADPDNQAVSRERKTGTYKDFVDEGQNHLITSVSGFTIGLDDVGNVSSGDILFQSSTLFSPILSVDLLNNTIEVQFDLAFTPGTCLIEKAYLCNIVWKQVFGDNPAFTRQFSEGLALFKNTRFNDAVVRFVTDFSSAEADVPIVGTGNSLWGLFGWGQQPWGGEALPDNIRFYIPQDKQLGSYLIPALRIQQGYSDFKCQGLSISYSNISQEVGL